MRGGLGAQDRQSPDLLGGHPSDPSMVAIEEGGGGGGWQQRAPPPPASCLGRRRTPQWRGKGPRCGARAARAHARARKCNAPQAAGARPAPEEGGHPASEQADPRKPTRRCSATPPGPHLAAAARGAERALRPGRLGARASERGRRASGADLTSGSRWTPPCAGPEWRGRNREPLGREGSPTARTGPSFQPGARGEASQQAARPDASPRQVRDPRGASAAAD